MTERAIYIRPDRGEFIVTVEPPLEIDFTKSCPDLKFATSYANMIGRLRRLPVTNLALGEVAQ